MSDELLWDQRVSCETWKVKFEDGRLHLWYSLQHMQITWDGSWSKREVFGKKIFSDTWLKEFIIPKEALKTVNVLL